MKTLVISGGGSKGAFAGGIAEYLINDCCSQYEMFVGCSTGSLLLPHLALGKTDKIKKIYTSVTQNDIFSICPFKLKKTKKGLETRINHFNTIRTFLKGSATFGESENLRSLIRANITAEEFSSLQNLQKKLIFTVSNLTLNTTEYINSNQCDYDDFCDWAWASCNYTPFMSLYTKNGYQYADGGFGNFIPILHAIEKGATDLDVIILESEKYEAYKTTITNPFSLLFRTFKFMNSQNYTKDILLGKLVSSNHRVNINFYFTPRHLTDNPLVFDTEQMTKWWQEGYDFAKSKKPVNF
jgi:predicted patatin/cPLA2 family phospholipase